jgi:hypothetical protein
MKHTLSLKISKFFAITFLLTLFIWQASLFAQLSEGGIPYSFNNNLRNPVVSIEMPPIDKDKLLAEDALDEKNGIPFRFGYPIEVNLDIKRDGTFELLPNGDKLWSLRITAPGATSINLNYNDFWIPEGSKLFLFNDDKSEWIGAFTKRNNKENGEFATGILRGDGVTLEYYEPAKVESPGIINISSVVHGYRDVFKKVERDFGSSGSCNNNTICPEGDPWRNEIRGAAMILTAGGSRLCSGSMINNVRQDLTPYFLSANHCGSSSNWIIMFRYESPQCSPSVNGPLNYTVQGTQLKANNSASDFSLFLLTEAPPDSYEVHFAGWSAIDIPSTSSVGIHHPSGDVKKISFDYDPTSSSDYEPSPYLPNSHWKITMWDDGTTEPGSSGSPLYDQNHRIIGQLHGGWASCTSLTPDYYGKFSMSWNYGSSPSTRLKDWLDPDNTGALVLDGWDPTIGDPDTVPPTSITDLAVVDPTSNSLRLTWTAPYDTSYGGVKAYDIRMSNAPITDTIAFQNAAPVPFSGQPGSAGSPESMEVTGLDFTTTYYFAIRSRDFWQNWSYISNSPGGTTFGAPVASVNPVSVSMILTNNTITTETVTLSNSSSGNSTLDYQISLENNTFPEGMVGVIGIPHNSDIEQTNEKDNPEVHFGQSIFGSGGPDAFGYKWIDSNEPNGPDYVWQDIVATGTQVTNWTPTGTFNPLDEGIAGPFPLGFNFKFYGNPKTQIYVNTNGILLFNTVSQNIFTNASIPGTAVPNEYIAPFWDDLDGSGQGTVHYKQDGNRFIIQFTNWQRYPTSGSLTFQVVLHSSGKILYYYNNMNSSTLNSATVGIENQDGTIGLQVAYNSTYVQNNLAVQISAEPDWLGVSPISGRLYNGNSVDIELTFRTEDFPLGDYSMDMKVSSNDPVNPTITVPVTLQIVPIPVELSSFSAEARNNNVVLNWTTASEINNSGFAVERKYGKWKMENGKWESVGFVEGKGSTTEVQSYSYSDGELNVGKYIYRLKQIDYDGSYEYSPEVEIEVLPPQEYSLKQNYPNPFNPATTIEYTLPENAEVRIEIYNALGELVRTLINGIVEAGYQKLSFDASSLPSGTYIYRMSAKGQSRNYVESKKMMLVK